MPRPEPNSTTSPKDTDDNLLRFHGDAAASAVEDAAGAYQSPSLIAAGADAQQVTVLATLLNLAMAALCLKAPGLILKAGLTRRGSLILSFVNLVAWVPLTLAFLLTWLGIAPVWFALLWFVNLAPAVLLSAQRESWLSIMVPREFMGRYLGQRLAIKSACYLGAFIFLGYCMDRSSGLAGFAVIFTVAIVAALADFIILGSLRDRGPEPAKRNAAEEKRAGFSFPDYVSDLKTRKLGRFITFTSLFYLTVGLTGPLYAVYMLQDLKLSYVSFTIIVAAEFVARIVSVPFWGRLADRSGSIRVLGIVARIIPVIPLLWLVSPHPIFLILVQMISGTCWGAFDLTTQSYVLKTAPAERRLWYLVYNKALVLLPTALGGIIGAISLGHIFPVLGKPVFSLFLVSGLSRLVIVIVMVPQLIDLAHAFGRQHPTKPVDDTLLHAAFISRCGLYYRRAAGCRAITAAPAPKARRIPPQPVRRPTSPTMAANTGGHGLYYRQRQGQTVNPVPRPAYLQEEREPLTVRPGLYYDRSSWAKYFKQSLVALFDEAGALPERRWAAVRVV